MVNTGEIQTKLERVRALMDREGIETLWLRRVENVAWITGGVDVAVNLASALGVASVVITADRCEMWTTTIEAPRLRNADQVEARGFALRVDPWEAPEPAPESAALGADYPMPGARDVSGAIGRLRARLLPAEQDRFRTLAVNCADAMQRAINRVTPGISEAEIAAALDYETRRFNITPIVTLVGTDERIYNVRHPLPSEKVMEQYAMLVLCGRQYGLVCSVTRLVHFGPLPDALARKQDACVQVDAAMIAASQPGARLNDIFRITQEAYARAGFEGEWQHHHQGGLAGYAGREIIATPDTDYVLEPGMVLAWNPSIAGVKCEDTVLVRGGGALPEVLTAMYGWPTKDVPVEGGSLARPLVLVAG